MSELISDTFTADGDSEEFVARKATILLGTTSGVDYGGGTVTLFVKQDPQKDWTEESTYTSGQQSLTTVEYAKGLRMKLTLSGATSPDLDYSIQYV